MTGAFFPSPTADAWDRAGGRPIASRVTRVDRGRWRRPRWDAWAMTPCGLWFWVCTARTRRGALVGLQSFAQLCASTYPNEDYSHDR